MGDMTVDELKSKKLWFLWSAKPGKNGKVTKVPFAANGGATGTDDAHKGTWVSFNAAESARNQFQASGIGLKISKGFFLLDIDHKDISDPFAQLMLSRFSSYAEVSPSGKGIHIIGQCDITKLPVHFDDRRKRLLAVCKDIKTVDAAMDIGNYQGFNMRIQFDGWSKEFILSVKHEAVSKVHLGADALGNITRINNLLDSYPEKLSEAQQRLETVYEQMANAKEEVGKPFPKEEELNQKLERLSELNALLNMDEREDAEAEVSESDEKEERPARGSIHEKLQIYKEKSQRESETGKDNRKRDFGLE